MRAPEGQLQQLGPWPAGANNLAAEQSVPGRSFRKGTNVVTADDGKVSRRDGFEPVIDAVEPHSLFAYGRRAFYADGPVLHAFELYDDGEPSVPVELFDGLVVDAPLARCLIEPDIYVSDGEIALRITPSNGVSPWALPTPSYPSLTKSPGGSLPPGVYFVAIAYRAANGEEGPLSEYTQIEATAQETAITVSMPPAPPGVSRTLIYMTKPNGTELLLFNSVPYTVQTVAITKQRLGRPAPADGLDPMPAGRFAAYYGGRLLVSVDEYLYWSEPMRYGLTQIDYNYTPFSEPITGIGVVGETVDGFFVGQQTRTYFMHGGDPADARLTEVYPAGMVPGTLTHVPGARLPVENPPTTPVPVWLATNGVFCAGLQDGTVLPLTETRYAANVGVDGAAIFMQQGGINRLVVTTRSPSENAFALTDAVSMELVRNGNSA